MCPGDNLEVGWEEKEQSGEDSELMLGWEWPRADEKDSASQLLR